nr:DUF2252 family protein [Candidatus Frankia alpina]
MSRRSGASSARWRPRRPAFYRGSAALFTWDLRRLVASLALLGRAKALSDAVITRLVEACVGAYRDRMRELAEGPDAVSSELSSGTWPPCRRTGGPARSR